MTDLVSIVKQLPLVSVQQKLVCDIKPLVPGVLMRNKKVGKAFANSCRFGILNPITILGDGTIIDGARRWMACVAWGHEEIPCRSLNESLTWEEAARICFFLNSDRPRRKTRYVPEAIKRFNPIDFQDNTLENRLERAANTLDIRAKEDIAINLAISVRRQEFSANYASVVDSAINTARELSWFARLFENPPFPVLVAEQSAKETVWQLSMISNSHESSIR